MPLLKRKRSDSEFSFSSSSTLSSPPRGESFVFTGLATTTPLALSLSRSSTPLHLHSRTLKRFRNNRPSEHEVHQHTLDLLYSAQQQQQQQQQQQIPLAETQPEPPVEKKPQQLQLPPTTNQPSLHSFWNLPSRVVALSATATPTLDISAPTSCDDCGAGLNGSGDDDDQNMMDVDSYGAAAEDHRCGACSKAVCFSCSVSNLGEQRRCLACAGREGAVSGPRATGMDSWLGCRILI